MSTEIVQPVNYKHLEQGEEILTENPDRFLLFPIQYPDVWTLYKKHQAQYWPAEEVDLSEDRRDWENKLNDNEREFIKTVLGFFAGADGIVGENLVVNFIKQVQIPEARTFYQFQGAMESIHAEMYSLLIEKYIVDPVERERVFTMYKSHQSVKRKADWAVKYLEDPELSFHERIIAFMAVEGIFFSASFCAIYWLKQKGVMPGLTFSNELISRDEGMHTDMAVLMYRLLKNKLPVERIHQIIKDAVDVERGFVRDALKVSMIGMNSKLMEQYVEFCADRLMSQIDVPKIYGSSNPFDFMTLISLATKTNFFERKVSSYRDSSIKVSSEITPNNSGNEASNNKPKFVVSDDF
uniref:ribonucleoside-diphosphate reductase n=1 Tax=Clandestinovirus TaxID=2831644 RepID=A0A8F8PM83_9VIRU|nr:ribonucleoside-diphosphate reductase [Clandestinovirus]